MLVVLWPIVHTAYRRAAFTESQDGRSLHNAGGGQVQGYGHRSHGQGRGRHHKKNQYSPTHAQQGESLYTTLFLHL